MREASGYREVLERLDQYTVGETLTFKQTAEFIGCSINTVKKYIPRSQFGIAKTTIADYLTRKES